MSARDEIRVDPVMLISGAVTFALVMVLGGALWLTGALNSVVCGGDCGPAAITTPDAQGRAASPVAAVPAGAPQGEIDPAAVRAALDEHLGDADLGPRVGYAVLDASGAVVTEGGPDALVPASTSKLLTTFAALSLLDHEQRFETSTVRSGDDLVLVGGGDPLLVTKLAKKHPFAERADLTTLAKRTADALKADGLDSVRLSWDDSLFEGSGVSDAWEKGYVPGVIRPITALVPAPDSAAATFASLLEKRGITVRGTPEEGTAPEDATEVASVRGGTVAQVVDWTLVHSDNRAAEMLLRHVALAAGEPATFAGGARAVEKALSDADLPTSGLGLHDGSGLSRDSRVPPETLAGVIALASRGGAAAPLLAGLPVGGFTGTLVARFGPTNDGRGVVHAKTGTLTGIHSLAGYVLDADGTPVYFALMADKTAGTFAARVALDEIAAALAACHCTSS